MKRTRFKKSVGVMAVGLLFVMTCFTACNPLSSEDTTTDSWEDTLEMWKTMTPKEIEEHIAVDVSETYRIDADVLISDKLETFEVNTIKLNRHVYEDVEAVLEKWLDYCGIETDAEIVVDEKDDILEDGNYMQFASANFGDDSISQAQVRSVYAVMSTPFSQNYSTFCLLQMYDRQAMGRFHYEFMKEPSEKELITESKILDIKKNIETIFETEYLAEYELYTCTLDRLEQVVEWEQEYRTQLGREVEKWDLTEADEGTVLCFRQGYEGIPFMPVGVSFDETGASWGVESFCKVTSSKYGIEGLALFNPYNIEGETGTVEILSFAELIERHIADSQGVDVTVVNVGLYYLPIYEGEGLEFMAKPVWYVQTEMKSDIGYLTRDGVLYDAVTGEVIQW